VISGTLADLPRDKRIIGECIFGLMKMKVAERLTPLRGKYKQFKEVQLKS
jgi:hypothetical protein